VYTKFPKPAEIEREWLLVDLEGQAVGRAASQIASLLRGKHKTTFSPHADTGDFVVCINADKVKLTGRKLTQKRYHRFTGFIGNIRSSSATEVLAKKPERIIKDAVRRMLPTGSLGRKSLRKLKVYVGVEHPHGAQKPREHKLTD
jgi:large subunit ribosomal protein L13